MKSKLKELKSLYKQCVDKEDDKHAEMYVHEIIAVLDEMHSKAYMAGNEELVSKIEEEIDNYIAIAHSF